MLIIYFSIYNNFNSVKSVRQITTIDAHSSHTIVMLHLKQAYKLCIAVVSRLVSKHSDEKPFNGEQRRITIFTGILERNCFTVIYVVVMDDVEALGTYGQYIIDGYAQGLVECSNNDRAEGEVIIAISHLRVFHYYLFFLILISN